MKSNRNEAALEGAGGWVLAGMAILEKNIPTGSDLMF